MFSAIKLAYAWEYVLLVGKLLTNISKFYAVYVTGINRRFNVIFLLFLHLEKVKQSMILNISVLTLSHSLLCSGNSIFLRSQFQPTFETLNVEYSFEM